jgi:uncharacterized membrane protein HdeD (DUF308 family)
MIQALLVFSPAIIFLIVGAFCIVFGIIRILHQKDRDSGQSINIPFMVVGCFGLVGAMMMLAVGTHAPAIVFFMMVLIGLLIVLFGEYSLYKGIRSQRTNPLAVWLLFFGSLSVIFPFPLLVHLQEPYTFLYVCVVFIGGPLGQALLIKHWMNKVK